jgi:hypothetical protein
MALYIDLAGATRNKIDTVFVDDVHVGMLV